MQQANAILESMSQVAGELDPRPLRADWDLLSGNPVDRYESAREARDEILDEPPFQKMCVW